MKKINKKVELFEYVEKPEDFLKKAFFRSKIEKVEIKKINEKKVAFVKTDAEGKKIILRNFNRLKKVKELAKRNYGIDEVRIR
jgi:transcription antitermination factor NusA-like protein